MSYFELHPHIPSEPLTMDQFDRVFGPADPQPNPERQEKTAERKEKDAAALDVLMDVAQRPTRPGMAGIPGKSLAAGAASLSTLERRAHKSGGLDVSDDPDLADEDYRRPRQASQKLYGGARGKSYRDTPNAVTARMYSATLDTPAQPTRWLDDSERSTAGAVMRAVPDHERAARTRGQAQRQRIRF